MAWTRPTIARRCGAPASAGGPPRPGSLAQARRWAALPRHLAAGGPAAARHRLHRRAAGPAAAAAVAAACSTARRAASCAGDLAVLHPDRSPGLAGRRECGDLVPRAARALRLQRARRPIRGDRSPGSADGELRQPHRGLPGRSNQAIVVMAHRDNAGTGPGANDNASGTAALIELARSYARAPPGAEAALGTTQHARVPLDGRRRLRRARGGPFRRRRGTAGGRWPSSTSTRWRRRPVAARARGDGPRSPAASLVRTAAARVLEQTGASRAAGRARAAARPGLSRSRSASRGRSWPWDLGRDAQTAGPRAAVGVHGHRRSAADRQRADGGRARRAGAGRLAGPRPRARAGNAQLRVPGLALRPRLGDPALLVRPALPFLFARDRPVRALPRRHIRSPPPLRGFRSRLGFWRWFALSFVLSTLVGRLGRRPGAAARAGERGRGDVADRLAWSSRGARRSRLARRARAAAAAAGRHRRGAARGLHRRASRPRPARTASWPSTRSRSLYLVPSLYAWLWLPQVRDPPAVGARPSSSSASRAAARARVVRSRSGSASTRPWYAAPSSPLGYGEPPAC